eukprot:gene11913-24955_t
MDRVLSKQILKLKISWQQVKHQSSKQSLVFDRNLKARQRSQSLIIKDSDYYDYLREEASNRLVDRLDDITRTFPIALDVGCHRQHIYKNISKRNHDNDTLTGGIQALFTCDSSDVDAVNSIKNQGVNQQYDIHLSHLVADEENLPFRDHTFDLVMSSMAMHWVNDIPQYLRKVKSILKPDGAFIASMLGGSTLHELRYSFYLAEQERRGGLSPHASPFALPSDVAGLMQSGGFTLPTIDIDTITVEYPDVFTLMEHLRYMGEGNAALNRQFHVGRDTFLAMAAIYQSIYGREDGTIPATFQ